MPKNAGWLDQANKFVEIMIFIENEIQKHKDEKNGRK